MLLAKALLLLCTALVVMANSASNAVASGAVFVGEDTTDPEASPVSIYKNPENHATAAASILVYSAKITDFTPSSLPPKSLVASLDSFLAKASSFPGFLLESNKQGKLPLNGSLIQLEQIVREESTSHGALIGRSMRDLVPGYIPDETLTQWILNLIVIEKPRGSDDVKFHLIWMTLEIKTDKGHNAVIPEQSAKLNSSTLRIQKAYLEQYADRLVGLAGVTRARDAIDFFASPKVPSAMDSVKSTTYYNMPSSFIGYEKQHALTW
ncbi:hypothetical protein DFQ26_003518 [Actinomortierella ambigua]|nr:hypothetical protein DFQ26_003518 [Actinomortierella ambigua]